jgi:ankyrin repeat protein
MGLKLAKEKLFHSIDSNNFSDVKYVLDKYPGLINEYFDNEKSSLPLTRACWLGKKEMAELLLERGADASMPVRNGFNAIFVSAQKGRTEVIELLAQKGSPVDVADNRGFTPLDIAIINGYYNSSLALIKHVF